MIAIMTIAAWLAGVNQMPLPIVEEASVQMVAGAAAPAGDDPLTRPIASSRAAEWLAPAKPEKIFGASYLVGFGGMSVALIDTGAGLVLIDGALPQAAPAILANVRALGFDPKDIKFILSTEPHFDHAGGLAALARDTGATVVASRRGAEGLRSGRHAQDDPQLAYGGSWPAVTRLRVVRDGEVLRLGKTAITAIATPGRVSEMSERTSANDPTAPVASAAIRSISWGCTRPATCEFPGATTGPGTISPKNQPMAITVRAPAATRPSERARLALSPVTTDSTVPRIGVISGATIIAPITVASESATTPAAAITLDSPSSSQNLLKRRGASSPARSRR